MRDVEHQNLHAQLGHTDEEMRRLAVERTTLLPASAALPLLVERLADASWRVRKSAVARLAALPERAGAVQALLEAIADGDNPGRRNAALEALAACGRSAVPELIRALESHDVDVRKQVVDVLGTIGDVRSEVALARTLEDGDANVRAAAADALSALGGSVQTGPLRRLAAEDPEPLVRLAALRALVRVEAAIPFATIEAALADPMLAAAGYAALGQSDDPGALDAILKGLLARRASAREAAARGATALVARADADASARIHARLREFAAAHEQIARDAAARLDDAPPSGRLYAIQFAALIGTPDAARSLAQSGLDAAVADTARTALSALGAALPSALAQAWGQLSAAERAFACSALAACGAPAAAERMLCTTLLDPSSEVRAAAARVLAECGTATSFGDLFARLAQDDPRATRENAEDEADALVLAIVQLAEREGCEATDAVIALIEERLIGGGENARSASARLLGRVARPADASLLRGLLADPSDRVRRRAVEAIARIGPSGAELLRVALADESPSVRSGAAQIVAEIDLEDADDDLAALAADRDGRVRGAVMSALAQRVATPETRARSLALLAAGLRSDGVVALAALASLQRIGGFDAAAIAALGLRSPEPEIVERAAACVGAHGGPAMRGELIGLLAHPAWPVRARAARELADQRAAAAVPHLHARLGEERDEFVRDALLAALASLER